MATQDIQQNSMGTMSPDVTTSTELDFRPKVLEHSQYRWSRLVPITGGQTVTLQPSTTTECSFEIPTKVLNLARTRLEFNVNIPASAGTGTAYSIHSCGVAPIDRLSLYTRNGVFLCDLNNFNVATNMLYPYTTSRDDLMNKRQVAEAISGAPPALPPTCTSGLQMSYADSTALLLAAAAGASQFPDNGLRGNWYPGYNNANGSEPFVEHRYLINNNGNPTHQQDLNLRYRIEFEDIPHNILSLDKSIYFGEILVLRVQWAPLSRIGITYLVAGHPGATTTTAILSTTSVVNDLTCYLAVETNRQVAESVIRYTASSGMRLLVPYLYTFKYTNPASTSVAVQQRLNRGHGRALLKVYHALYNSTESGRLAYDHHNSEHGGFPGKRVVDVYTMLDNDRLQEITMSCSRYDDYTMIKPLIHESCVFTPKIYAANWLWVDDWTGRKTCEWKKTDTADCGLSLDQERLWTIQLTVGAAAGASQNAGVYNHYTLFVTQKLLTVTPTQITMV